MTMRKFLRPAWFLFAGSFATAASAPSINVTADCPLCGPGQPFPHDCPRADELPANPAAPDPLTALLETARGHHRRLASIAGLALAPLGPPRSMRELDAQLTALLATTRTTLAKIEREQAVAHAEAQRITARVADLRAQIAQATDELAAVEREIPLEQAKAVASRNEFLAAQKSATALREQIRQARNRLFPRLHLAAHRGWILPPSSYREVPGPLAALSPAYPIPGLLVSFSSRNETLARLGEGIALEAPLKDQRLFGLTKTDSRELEQNLRTKLNEFAALYYRAYAVFTVPSDVSPAVAAEQAAAVAKLESDLAPMAVRRSEGQRALAAAVRQAVTERARADEIHRLTAHSWIEASIYRFLDRRIEAVMSDLVASASDAARLASLGEWAAIAAQLGSEPAGVLARLPSILAARRELFAELRREVATRRTEPGIAIDSGASTFPVALRIYLSEVSP